MISSTPRALQRAINCLAGDAKPEVVSAAQCAMHVEFKEITQKKDNCFWDKNGTAMSPRGCHRSVRCDVVPLSEKSTTVSWLSSDTPLSMRQRARVRGQERRGQHRSCMLPAMLPEQSPHHFSQIVNVSMRTNMTMFENFLKAMQILNVVPWASRPLIPSFIHLTIIYWNTL